MILQNIQPTVSKYVLPRWLSGKESTCQCRRCKRCRFDPWIGKIPWRRKWQPTPVLLPGKSHGRRSLAGYSPRGSKSVGHDLATEQHNNRIQENATVLDSLPAHSELWDRRRVSIAVGALQSTHSGPGSPFTASVPNCSP